MSEQKKQEVVSEEAAQRGPSGIKTMADFTSPEILYHELMNSVKRYHPSSNLGMIEKAFQIANDAHQGQVRKSGEPYIIHPLCVAIILADLELDKETIAAGLLHDVVEDTVMTQEELAAEFGEEVALLVNGVTKLGQFSYKADKIEVQAENLRKMFLAMAKDIRVILIKLADRLHNMRTLQYMRPEKQKEKARETMDIYAPLAQRLGISKIKVELDDLSLKYLEPEVYYDLVEKISLKKREREDFVATIVDDVTKQLKEANIQAKINGRAKHFFSIYKKMVNQNKTIDQIYDLFAVRIIVDSLKDCYASLGVIHEMYKPVPGRFKDYIAMPKQNMYQSLHTTLIGPEGKPFEIQIRTAEMHKTAEYGIAAHWKYKESSDGKQPLSKQEEEKMSWLRQILEWQTDMSDNHEFLSLLKSDLDLFGEIVYCFTPAGDVKSLPNGSTPIDFAYSIHSAVGNRMVGARVNGRLVSFDYRLQNGDRVEIMTSQNVKGPSRDWLKVVKSTQAKNKINQWFKQEFKEENIVKGREMIETYAKAKKLPLEKLMVTEFMNAVMEKYGFHDWDSLLAAIGHGGLKEGQILNKMMESYESKKKKEITDEDIQKKIAENAKKPKRNNTGGITLTGMDDAFVRFSKCCSPVPGDEIVGFITRGRGISVHRTDCLNIVNLSEGERTRLVDVSWPQDDKKSSNKLFLVEIKIFAYNRSGLLVDVSKIITERNVDIKATNTNTSKQGIATMAYSFEVSSKEQLQSLIEQLHQVKGVIDIQRV